MYNHNDNDKMITNVNDSFYCSNFFLKVWLYKFGSTSVHFVNPIYSSTDLRMSRANQRLTISYFKLKLLCIGLVSTSGLLFLVNILLTILSQYIVWISASSWRPLFFHDMRLRKTATLFYFLCPCQKRYVTIYIE